MKIEKRIGQKVKFLKDFTYYRKVAVGRIDKVVRRGGNPKIRIVGDNYPDEGNRADYVDEDQIFAYFDKNRNEWIQLNVTSE